MKNVITDSSSQQSLCFYAVTIIFITARADPKHKCSCPLLKQGNTLYSSLENVQGTPEFNFSLQTTAKLKPKRHCGSPA